MNDGWSEEGGQLMFGTYVSRWMMVDQKKRVS